MKTLQNIGRSMALICALAPWIAACGDDQPDVPEPLQPEAFQAGYFNRLDDTQVTELVYSKAVYLKRNAVMQSFDVTADGTLYYVQIAGNDQHQLHVLKGRPAEQMPAEVMTLEYFGHGTNMAVEENPDGQTYIWLNGYGTKGSDGAYGGSQVICRFPFEAGKVHQHAAGELFYLEEARNIHPALDASGKLLGITYTKTISGISARYFLVFHLAEALALPENEVKLTAIKYGNDNQNATEEETEEPKVKVRDLGRLTPVMRVVVPEGIADLGRHPFQGFDISDRFIFYFEGEGNANDGKAASVAKVSVIDRQGCISAQKEVKAISDPEMLKAAGIADQGYMEGEGIKVKDGVLYLGFASRIQEGDKRLANIFRYAE